jgi:hypothetical protein
MKRRTFGVAILAIGAMACSRPAPTPDLGIENAELGIKLSAAPEGMTVTQNQGASLELGPSEEGKGGTIWFVVGPEQEGVNLVAAVQDHQSHIESLADGSYNGGQELQGDFGTAFYSRGRFTDAGSEVEETVLFLIHPAGNRLLEIHYRYPAGNDSAARVEQLIGVLSDLE